MKIFSVLSIATIVLIAFSGFHPNEDSEINKALSANNTLKVLSYNVRHCNPPGKKGVIDMESIAKVIKDANPDLVALQEIDRFTKRSGVELDQAKELGKLTGMYSYFVKAINWEGGEYGIAVLSKFEILDSINLQLPMMEGKAGEARAVAIIKVKAKGRKILFASTHLDIVKEHRELQAAAITNYFAGQKLPVILAGDFNDIPGSETVSMLQDHFHITCAVLSCGKTFPQVNPDRTIDYIMYHPAKKFKTINHQVIPEEYASDHRPIVATFKLN